MATLLHIDASPLGPDSISRHLTAEFANRWKEANPGGRVITRDLTKSGLTAIDADWIAAAYTPPANRTNAQRERLALSDTLIDELRQAGEYVIGAPMHNFTIAANLKLWIDMIARGGETFALGADGKIGLLDHKKATFIITSGFAYGPGTGRESFDFVEPYLRGVFGFLGVTDARFHVVDGVTQIRSGKVDRESFLRTHVEAIRSALQPV